MADNGDILDPELQELSTQNGDGGELPYAVATLVLGIISIIGCTTYGIVGMICGIIAVSLHSKDRKMYNSNRAYFEKSYKVANAGNVCAIIGIVLSSIGLVLLFILIAGAATRGF